MFLSQDEANTKVRKGNWNSSRSSVWESIVSSLRRKHWDSYLLARADWTESLPLLPPTGDRIATRDRHGTGFLPFLCPLVRLTATLGLRPGKILFERKLYLIKRSLRALHEWDVPKIEGEFACSTCWNTGGSLLAASYNTHGIASGPRNFIAKLIEEGIGWEAKACRTRLRGGIWDVESGSAE
jgi:hypothetical protein